MAEGPELKEGIDYYFNEAGLMVFTEQYHLRRGYCCRSGCLHCPYGYTGENRKTGEWPEKRKPGKRADG